MGDTRIVFNSEGFRQVLTSAGTKDLITQTTNEIRDRANANNTRGGDGFVASVIEGNYGGGRWVGFVTASDKNAMVAESEDLALTRAIT